MDKLFIKSWFLFVGGLVLVAIMGIRMTAPKEDQLHPLTLKSSETPVKNPMITIPAGFFLRGSENGGRNERPVRKIFLDRYKISRFEITQGEYTAFVQATRHRTPLSRYVKNREQFSDMNQPVIYVSWLDAEAFCKWRGERLPTEAEWEKAAKGNQSAAWPWGEETKPFYANLRGAADGNPYTALVGSFQTDQSSYGLYDIVGNAKEWVADWYDPLYYDLEENRNPQGPPTGDMKTLRGGSWNDSYQAGRLAGRIGMFPDYRDTNIGFRCAST